MQVQDSVNCVCLGALPRDQNRPRGADHRTLKKRGIAWEEGRELSLSMLFGEIFSLKQGKLEVRVIGYKGRENIQQK